MPRSKNVSKFRKYGNSLSGEAFSYAKSLGQKALREGYGYAKKEIKSLLGSSESKSTSRLRPTHFPPGGARTSRAGRGALVAAPVAAGRSQRFAGSLGSKSKTVCHTEQIATINGSVAFATTSFLIQPANRTSFPWLADEALKWEQYRFRYLRYRYLARCGTTTTGSVTLSPEYDVYDSLPLTEAEAANTQDSVEDSAWKEIECDLDTSAMFPNGPRKFVRNGNSAETRGNYDCGRFTLATVGQASTAVIGKLYVDYEIEFYVPQNSNTNVRATCTTHAHRAAVQNFVTAVGQNLVPDANDGDGANIGAHNGLGVWTPPRGAYQVTATCVVVDSMAETLTSTMFVAKNGASQGQVVTVNDAIAAGGTRLMTVSDVILCDGAETMSVALVLTGPAGGLSIMAGSMTITVRAA
jgi:hypothetical protein